MRSSSATCVHTHMTSKGHAIASAYILGPMSEFCKNKHALFPGAQGHFGYCHDYLHNLPTRNDN